MTSQGPCRVSTTVSVLFNYLKKCHLSILRKSLSDVSYTRRTVACGSLRKLDVGRKVTLCGWVHHNRLSGNFIILRDWQGTTQLNIPKHKMDITSKLTYESVIEITGTVVERPSGLKNQSMDTGEIEVSVEEVKVLNEASPQLPFQLSKQNEVNESLRMKYRYLDLRSKKMQHNLRLRSSVIMKMRHFLADLHGFVDVETPVLFRRTPGGAKEFVVPSHQKGMFYSLPQSPQQFKQLLMVGGIDRYFQIAKCFRDEGAKPDRQPEFTQLDLEMSFVDREGVLGLIEAMLVHSWPSALPPLSVPFPRLTYHEAMSVYGSDKPDTRFDMKISDQSVFGRQCGEPWIESALKEDGTTLVAIRVQDRQDVFSNSLIKKLLKEVKMEINNDKMLLLPIKLGPSSDWKPGLFSVGDPELEQKFISSLNLQPSDLVFLAAGPGFQPHECLGRMRLKLASILEETGVQGVRNQDVFNFLWVVDFPLFTPVSNTENSSKVSEDILESTHHPFTDVHPEDEHLLLTQPLKARSLHYDLVLNGNEVGGGSIRIHDPHKQEVVLQKLNIDSSHLRHMLEAFSMGCPPHGGIALGLDRFFSVLCRTPSIRDVIAFPKTVDGKDPMSNSPAPVDQADLDTYHIQPKP